MMPIPVIDPFETLTAPTGNGKLYIGKERSAAYDWWPGHTRVRLNVKTEDGVIERKGYCGSIDIAESVCEIWVEKGEISKNFHEAADAD